MGSYDPEMTAGAAAGAFTAIEVLARALHVKNAELQPTLDVVVANAAAAYPAARQQTGNWSRRR